MRKQEEALFWSIALPGFGQLINGKFIKGILFLILEFLINVQGNFNEVIISSFQFEIEQSILQADFQWLMFYPCLYFYAMWDAFRDAGGGIEDYSFLPFVFAAYFVTVGCIYSTNFRLFGVLLGPVWLPILCVIPGVTIGLILKKSLIKTNEQ